MKKSIIDKAIQHLNKDSKIRDLILKQSQPVFRKAQKPFNALCKSIIFQQLSGKSANAIYQRFIKIYNGTISENSVLKTEDKKFRKIGISHQKIRYLKALASFFSENKKNNFNSLSDEKISRKLIKVNGIGQWTIDMFLMFTLFRTDILPVSDLGIKKGFKILYNLEKLPTYEFMINKSKPWSPYKSIASVYIWGIVDSDDNW